MNASVTCRCIDPNALDELMALEAACYTSDLSKRCNLRRLLRSPSAFCMGAFSEKKMIGNMIALFRSNSEIARIYSLAVLPEARRTGLGRQLMENALQEARRRGCRRMRLEVRMDNIPAIALYEQLGFVDTQMLPGYYEDGAHAFVMSKELDDCSGG